MAGSSAPGAEKEVSLVDVIAFVEVLSDLLFF